MAIITRFWKTLGVLTLIIGVIFVPKDLQEIGDAAEPWRRMWSMVDQNTALWIVTILMGGWIIWTDVRPIVRERWQRFPPQHAVILQQIADSLSKAEHIAAQRRNALAAYDNEQSMAAYRAFFFERLTTERLANQIAYDAPTLQTVRDYLQLCAIILDDELSPRDNQEERALLEKLRGPVFRALHAGKSINRKALPLADWMRTGEDRLFRKRSEAVLRALEGK